MAVRSAEAVWVGTLKEGKGELKLGSGSYTGPYTFVSRFEEGAGTNPEELIAAAEAGCFTMDLGNRLSSNGFTVNRLHSRAEVFLERIDGKNTFVRIELNTEGDISGVDEATFLEYAETAKSSCIITRALNPSIQFVLNAKLV